MFWCYIRADPLKRKVPKEAFEARELQVSVTPLYSLFPLAPLFSTLPSPFLMQHISDGQRYRLGRRRTKAAPGPACFSVCLLYYGTSPLLSPLTPSLSLSLYLSYTSPSLHTYITKILTRSTGRTRCRSNNSTNHLLHYYSRSCCSKYAAFYPPHPSPPYLPLPPPPPLYFHLLSFLFIL